MYKADVEQSNMPKLKEYLVPFFTDDCPRIHTGEFPWDEEAQDYTNYSKRYRESQRALIRLHVLTDEIAMLPLDEITPQVMINFFKRLANRTPGRTAIQCNVVKVLKIVFGMAVIQELIMRDPCKGIKAKKVRKKTPIPFTLEELGVLFFQDSSPFADYEARMAYLLDVATGMRRGEILALKWGHLELFDPKNAQITGYARLDISTAVKGDTRTATIGKTKTNTARVAYLGEIVAAEMAEYKKAREKAGYYLQDDHFIFCDEREERRSFSWWNRNFRSALEKAGINPKGKTPHTFRHTLQSLMAGHSFELMDNLRKQMGWTNESIQFRTYTEQMESGLRNTADGINLLIKRAKESGDTLISFKTPKIL